MSDQSPRDDERPAETAWDRLMAEHEARLTVGTRVRYRRSAECIIGHSTDVDGDLGEIVHVMGTASHTWNLRHDYMVTLDRHKCGEWSGLFAASELIPLDTDA